MQTHLLTPMAPLVLRTGKPFGDTGGGDSFMFPLPSTVAGALRAAHADEEKLDFATNKEAILGLASHSALPASIDAQNQIKILFPCPADARYIRPAMELMVRRLKPVAMMEDEGCDLWPGLRPVFLEGEEKAKPAAGPSWWSSSTMLTWLLGDDPDSENLGPEQTPVDTRTHVALNPDTLAAKFGHLFQSSGPDFEARRCLPDTALSSRGWSHERYGLLARFEHQLKPTMVRLGGEGRMASVASCDGWPRLPAPLKSALEQTNTIRLALATPALFSGGWKPGWIGADLTGSPPGFPELVLCLKAAAVTRWQALSGWDMVAKQPKAVRRLVPAGSVYWFEVVQAPAEGWEKIWLAPISDSEQDRRDGFGLALPGIWKK